MMRDRMIRSEESAYLVMGESYHDVVKLGCECCIRCIHDFAPK
jgi:hypothetical protein